MHSAAAALLPAALATSRSAHACKQERARAAASCPCRSVSRRGFATAAARAPSARDSAALADLLLGLGVACDVDLAYVDDADCLSLRALLKQMAANSFASKMKTVAMIMKARSMCSDAKHEAAARDYTAACFEYLQQAPMAAPTRRQAMRRHADALRSSSP